MNVPLRTYDSPGARVHKLAEVTAESHRAAHVSDDFKLHTFGGENGTLAVTRPTGGGVQRGATGG